MRYKASRGGHAPGHLRDAFLEYLDSNQDQPIELNDTVIVGYEGGRKSPRWVIGQLWNCTDILPAGYCDELELPVESSYAVAVRSLV